MSEEPLAVLVFGHEVAPRTQTDDSHGGLRREFLLMQSTWRLTEAVATGTFQRQRASDRPPRGTPTSPARSVRPILADDIGNSAKVRLSG